MTFHTDKDFKDAILRTSEYFKIREVIIEKDYWATHVLRNLSLSQYKEQVVFKGGTSLSKAYNCIDRFSEDIDLAMIEGKEIGDARLKKLTKGIETEITKGLELIADHAFQEKFTRNRKTFYHYPKVITDQQFGNVRDVLQVEINSFTHPVPHYPHLIETYIAQFLRENKFPELIQKHSLQPFELNVLSLERTFFEKLSSLIRLSYDGNEALKKKIRHFFDLYKLQKQEGLNESLLTEKSFALLTSVLDDDKDNKTFAGPWLEKPMSNSPLFQNLKENWRELQANYGAELSGLTFSGSIPEPDQILSLLEIIKRFLEEYDKKSS